MKLKDVAVKLRSVKPSTSIMSSDEFDSTRE